MGGPTAAGPRGTPSDTAQTPSRSGTRVGHAKARISRARGHYDESVAGALQRRITELDVMNKALLLSALALMLFIPALITLTAVLPVGSDQGLAANWARHIGLSSEAAHDVRQLFNTTNTVRGPTTALSGIITLAFAFGWPAELQRGYQIIWELPSRGIRDMWRPAVWLLAFFPVVALVAASGSVAAGLAGALLTGFVGFPLVFVWTWWTQHLLLSGRVSYRSLVPGALATAVGLLGLGVVMSLYLSNAVVSNYNQYGPIGVVFALLSWIIGFCVVMLGGPLAGHVYLRRRGLLRPAEVDLTS
jgi:membrane protein